MVPGSKVAQPSFRFNKKATEVNSGPRTKPMPGIQGGVQWMFKIDFPPGKGQCNTNKTGTQSFTFVGKL